MQSIPDGDSASGNNQEDSTGFNLRLNEFDRIANISGGLGVGLTFMALDEVETTTLLEGEHNITAGADAQMNYEIAKTLATVNWLFFITVMIFFYTSSQRLEQLKETQDLSNEWSEERIRGRELVTLGEMFKIIGFFTTAEGFEIIADSTLREEQLTPPT